MGEEKYMEIQVRKRKSMVKWLSQFHKLKILTAVWIWGQHGSETDNRNKLSSGSEHSDQRMNAYVLDIKGKDKKYEVEKNW